MATAHRPAGQKELIEARRTRVWNLRVAGASMRQIATQENVNAATIKRDLDVTLARLNAEQVEVIGNWRDIELARLDKLLLSVWSDATNAQAKGRNFAIDRAVSIIELQAKMLGLFAPDMNININFDTLSDADLEALASGKRVVTVAAESVK